MRNLQRDKVQEAFKTQKGQDSFLSTNLVTWKKWCKEIKPGKDSNLILLYLFLQ